jgi:hypothetical protein
MPFIAFMMAVSAGLSATSCASGERRRGGEEGEGGRRNEDGGEERGERTLSVLLEDARGSGAAQ